MSILSFCAKTSRFLGRGRTKALVGVAAAATAIGCLSAPATAADPKLLGTFGDWSAYSVQEDGSPVCYAASQPTKAEGDYTQRGSIYALITHRPKDKDSLYVISIVAGYPYKPDSEATLAIGKKEWSLFVKGERAWARDAKTDRTIADSMRKGSSMVVTGTSQRGTQTTDTYSLRGSSQALDAINKACNVSN